MKYFTKELFDRFNSDDVNIVEKAHDEWKEAIDNYRNYLDTTYDRYPPSVRKFIETCCFHDAQILYFNFVGSSFGKSFLKVTPEKGEEKIIEFDVDRNGVYDYYYKKGSYWLYEEFEAIENNKFKLSILLDNGTELEILFSGDLKIYEISKYDS